MLFSSYFVKIINRQRQNWVHTVFSLTCRSVVLRMAGLGVLLLTLWQQITCKVDIYRDNCTLCPYNSDIYPVIPPLEHVSYFYCASSSQTESTMSHHATSFFFLSIFPQRHPLKHAASFSHILGDILWNDCCVLVLERVC